MYTDDYQYLLVIEIELSRGEILVTALHVEATHGLGRGGAPPAVRGHGAGPGTRSRHPGARDFQESGDCLI